MLALMLMVIVLQNISVSNQHIVYLKCTQCYVSIISQFKKKMKKKSTHTLRQVTIKSSNKPIIILYIRKPNLGQSDKNLPPGSGRRDSNSRQLVMQQGNHTELSEEGGERGQDA